MTATYRLTRRHLLVRVLFALVLGIASACGGDLGSSVRTSPAASPAITAVPTQTGAAFPVTVVDFQGKSVVIPKRPERIVSIGPSNTEFLFALGAGDRVVGVDDFSDEPAAAKTKEKVGGVKPNVERIVSLRPELLVSVRISDGSLERIAAQSIPVLVIDPQGIADAARSAVLLGTAIGADGAALAKKIDDGISEVRTKAASLTKRRVFHEVDASDPSKLYTAGPGSFIHDMIVLAGGINVAANAPTPFPQLSLEEIVRADPEIIVLGDAAYGVSVEQVIARPGWSSITAVRNKRIVPVDANLMHRPGPRLAQALEAYLKIVSETR
jgi:iron complex transport system substrate-binding protein